MSDPRQGKADALLDTLHRQGPGRLTLFLGAAPGVGKTFAMLTRARELQGQGVDVVAGVIETHGRAETAALLHGLPTLPPRCIEHQGHRLAELDLDALLARRPALALVDELAHRNAPGSRHDHRWQDVHELLDAGIDVHTTMNVQHLASLNDVVHRITGVRVRETVPDALLDRLRDVRLVDLPARELIERLQAGKVYVPAQAAQALQAFFVPANLIALRELAMQTVADHVDSDLREARAASGLAGLGMQPDVLVAIDGRGQSSSLVRAGRRIAERRGVPWSVVTVQTGDAPGAERQAEIDQAFALARSLGAATEVLFAPDVAGAILDAAALRGANTIIIGHTRARPLARLLNRTLSQQLLTRGAHHELTIVSPPQARRRARQRTHTTAPAPAWQDAGLVLAATAAAAGLAWLAQRLVGLEDLSLVFLVAVVLVAARARMGAAVATALTCFLAYDFFFIEPVLTLRIGAPRGVATVLLFLVAALVAGRLAARLRQQVMALRAANRHATAMQGLGRALAQAADLPQVIAAGAAALREALGMQTWLRVLGREDPHGADALDAKDAIAADWTQRQAQPSGRHTDTLSQSSWWFVPVGRTAPAHGVAALRPAAGAPPLTSAQRRLAEHMIEDIGQAALRTRLVADLQAARVAGETEKLRSALLSSVSHDLRSPLSTIIGAADSLREYGANLPAADRDALLVAIRDEGDRLNRYIQNLLDMTRLGQPGGLALTREWVGIDELLGAATRRLLRQHPGTVLRWDLPADLPPIEGHPALIEQALFNVLENAAQFSGANAPIDIGVRRAPDGFLQVDISDAGPGIPPDERARIFDMFYSVERGDRGRAGTGLGLAIVQAIVGAHQGRVQALPGPQGAGTTVRLTLPWTSSPAADPT